VRLLIIVNERGECIVVATGKHAGRSIFLLDCGKTGSAFEKLSRW
jgi:hypothetical protein